MGEGKSCPVCHIFDRLCEKLPDPDFCKQLVKKVEKGLLSPEKVAELMREHYSKLGITDKKMEELLRESVRETLKRRP